MSKVLLLTLEFPPQVGGVGRMYYELCRFMPAGSIVVWTPPVTDLEGKTVEQAERFTVRRQELLARRGPGRWLRTFVALRGYLEHHGLSDVIVGQILPLGLPVWLLSLERPLRYAVFVHGMDITQACMVPRRRWAIKHILRGAQAVFAANAFMVRVVQELGVPPERIAITYPPLALQNLPNAATVDFIRQQEHLQDEPVLVTVGRLIDRKGHDIVLQALELVWPEFPNLKYYIIGRGPAEKRLRALTTTLSHSNQVNFLGQLPDALTSAWLSLATVFIMTPRQLPDGDVEGFGMVYLEAGYLGKPVVASRSGGVTEAVVDQVTGLVVPANDIGATAEAIIRLLRDPALRQQLGQAGQARALQFTGCQSMQPILKAFNIGTP